MRGNAALTELRRGIYAALAKASAIYGFAEKVRRSLVDRMTHATRSFAAMDRSQSPALRLASRVEPHVCPRCEGFGIVDRGDHDGFCDGCDGTGQLGAKPLVMICAALEDSS